MGVCHKDDKWDQIVADVMHIIGGNQQNIYQGGILSGKNPAYSKKVKRYISRLEFRISIQ